MWAALVVGFVYLVLLVRFARHAFNVGFFFMAGFAALLASGAQLYFDQWQAGETRTMFRGNLVLFEYGELRFGGVVFFLGQLLIQAVWFGVMLKWLVDEEYKEQTPAGVRPGAASQTDSFGRRVYECLHTLFDGQDYQKLDQRIVASFGSFDGALRYRTQNDTEESLAIFLAAEMWTQILKEKPLSERQGIAREIANAYRDPSRVSGLSTASVLLFRSITKSWDWASEGRISEQTQAHLPQEILRALRDQPSGIERMGQEAQQFGRDFGKSMMSAVDDYFQSVNSELLDRYLDVLRERLDRQELTSETIASERAWFAREVENLQTDTREALDRKLGEWLHLATEVGVRDELDRQITDRYAEAKTRFRNEAEFVFREFAGR